ncbi:hypothetical protein E3O25_03050 [Cryobacterium sp. TMT1-3]|uniref:Uncharacterized protein n=1 Tax=Cryobacterium luteum TaxID=1424661 RepID=A0A1H8G2I1_9MICO|nr:MULTISPECIES: hypothetical protein [Cryobacterium]TFB93832.1 hypothetical protein E3O10_02165 [Cryobacterium luteum]TFC30669.1 hypothetical protein E3O25_03050 [Cryobacterium sp. TMT1-3]SEN37965.1 RNA polymerase sigma-70 factor, ECF subfamily [Cryobacterium luteum]
MRARSQPTRADRPADVEVNTEIGVRTSEINAWTAAVETLLQCSARGNRTAFAQLYDMMAVPVYAVILTRATNGPQAERLLLEVFLGLWERCPLYPQGSRSAVPWILAYAEQTADYDELLPLRPM